MRGPHKMITFIPSYQSGKVRWARTFKVFSNSIKHFSDVTYFATYFWELLINSAFGFIKLFAYAVFSVGICILVFLWNYLVIFLTGLWQIACIKVFFSFQEKKQRRRDNLKRRLENERKAEVVQVVSFGSSYFHLERNSLLGWRRVECIS